MERSVFEPVGRVTCCPDPDDADSVDWDRKEVRMVRFVAQLLNNDWKEDGERLKRYTGCDISGKNRPWRIDQA